MTLENIFLTITDVVKIKALEALCLSFLNSTIRWIMEHIKAIFGYFFDDPFSSKD